MGKTEVSNMSPSKKKKKKKLSRWQRFKRWYTMEGAFDKHLAEARKQRNKHGKYSLHNRPRK